jgi:hypothetical protein
VDEALGFTRIWGHRGDGDGGGIHNDGKLIIVDCTLSQNFGANAGGTIANEADANIIDSGTAEQWIREGKQEVKMTRLSCRRFVANEVRLWLSIIAYNLGNL